MLEEMSFYLKNILSPSLSILTFFQDQFFFLKNEFHEVRTKGRKKQGYPWVKTIVNSKNNIPFRDLPPMKMKKNI